MAALDRGLHEKYDAALPRYTSYPTAPHFASGLGEADYREWVDRSNGDPLPKPLSLYVHIPFCASLCYYCACNKIITRREGKAAVYLDYLQREIAMQAAQFDRDRPLRQLHFGGGTPTYLADEQMRELMGFIEGIFPVAPAREREFSIEVDPRAVGEGTVPMLAELGFDRMSIGVQDFDPKVQQAVNRVQSFGLTKRIVDVARRSGFQSVCMDLIYGLPYQSREGFAETVDKVLELQPERLSIYSYAHLPQRVKAQRLIPSAALPSPAEKLGIMEDAFSRLTQAGYRAIGMDHFALPDSPLSRALDEGTLQRNFQGYSTHADCDLLGVGVSAIGKIGDAFVQNTPRLPAYYAALDEGRLPLARGYERGFDDTLRATVIERVMCRNWVGYHEIENRFGVKMRHYFAEELAELAELEADGLVRRHRDGLALRPEGQLLRRNIAAVFDVYLRTQAAPARYSRSI